MLPAVAAALAPLLTSLASQGLGLLGSAIMAKGKDVIEKKLGVDIEAEMGTEEGRLRLMQLQMENEADLRAFTLAQKQQEIDEEALRLKDVDSARQMQMTALQQGDTFSKRYTYHLATAWSIAAMLYLGFITFGNIPKDNVRFADTILGFLLGTVVATILQFFYGSSRGSKDSGDTVREIAKKVTGVDDGHGS